MLVIPHGSVRSVSRACRPVEEVKLSVTWHKGCFHFSQWETRRKAQRQLSKEIAPRFQSGRYIFSSRESWTEQTSRIRSRHPDLDSKTYLCGDVCRHVCFSFSGVELSPHDRPDFRAERHGYLSGCSSKLHPAALTPNSLLIINWVCRLYTDLCFQLDVCITP